MKPRFLAAMLGAKEPTYSPVNVMSDSEASSLDSFGPLIPPTSTPLCAEKKRATYRYNKRTHQRRSPFFTQEVDFVHKKQGCSPKSTK